MLQRLAFFPGSTIGNQTPSEAAGFLANVRHLVGDEGAFLVGVDLKKDSEILNRAYNSSENQLSFLTALIASA